MADSRRSIAPSGSSTPGNRFPRRRGDIFDSTGMLMAGTVQTRDLFIDPKFMQDQFQEDGKSLVEMDEAVAKLAKLIDKDPFKLSKMLGDRAESRYVKVAEHLDDSTCEQIEKLDLPGVGTYADATCATIRWARSPPTCSAACRETASGWKASS